AIELSLGMASEGWETAIAASLLLSPALLIGGRVDEAERICTQCLAIVTERGDRFHRAALRLNMGFLHRMRGDIHAEFETVKLAHDESVALGDVNGVFLARMMAAELCLRTGRLSETTSRLVDLYAIARRAGARSMAWVSLFEARVAALLEDPE